ncbi:amidophosphoribosyltransferase [Puniceicoccales bacterium CK1056]|uniref:Amidophosphoribosyltransferase n=1 Tax=Oceanipulchritudo coccoides TaxID=2706888 RepID=A0A6B2LZ36_9BACT|nr:amidophosphoribosyltransferase [Oceanipulchritudo coccoides]NDV61204.1 amidophosphoribosyltransferase [Oceanipulchritudo coccoides]
MSELIKHECGIALIRLKKPLGYYQEKYGSPLYGFSKLFLLMEKQHNRGQDGAGIGCVKLNMPHGQSYMHRERVLKENSLGRLFKKPLKKYDKLVRKGIILPEYTDSVKAHFDFGGEVLVGHLRYGTSGNFTESSCHPYFRRSNWPTRNLMVCGNFNMTNTAELNRILINRGQHPIFDTDTQTILEEIGFHLDEAHDAIYHKMRDNSNLPGSKIPEVISDELDLVRILRKSASVWDGGYALAGLVGNGDAFVMRDPHGIRPVHYFEDDEVIAFASERVPLMTAFDKEKDAIQEVPPGHVVSMKNDGEVRVDSFANPAPRSSCTFERIYFSRGNDPDIYTERKRLGGALCPQILEEIDYNLEDAVFSYIPNTAETASYGLLHALRMYRRTTVKEKILEAHADGSLDESMLDDLILNNWPRAEKIAHKDIKLRTFISQEKGRSKMVSHVYDITYDVVEPKDNLVVLDDSIVRGTTLRQSIIKILSRTNPKAIIVASTAPQIRYPDCYGIDMSELGKFIAFQAAIALLKDRGAGKRIEEVYQACLEELKKPKEEQVNRVKEIYASFSPEDISTKIAELLYPQDIPWKGRLVILYQTIENLHASTPGNTGDWYFSGNYPTAGGIQIANQAFIQYYENRSGRSYDV